MVTTGFLLGLVLLLATPGPTNTLLALAGATARARTAPVLLLAELAAYLTAVTGSSLLANLPGAGVDGLRPWMQGAAALYLIVLASRLWRSRAEATGGGEVGPIRVAATTLLNPKTLIIAFVLLPAGWLADGGVAARHLAAMAVLIPLVGGSWFLAGRLLAAGGGARVRGLIPRVSAMMLALFAMALAGRALAG
jgi:threonine/homoserine/homoserine lactone efflux protein